MTVFREQKAYYCENTQSGDASVHPATVQQGAKAVACLPLKVGGETVGVLWIHFRDPHHFSEVEKEALKSYAIQSALVFDRSRRMEEASRTRRELDASNTLLWMNMISNVWRHSIENSAYVVSDTVDWIHSLLGKEKLDADQIKKSLETIKDQAKIIMEKPITPPLSSEEGVMNVEINELVQERINQLWDKEKFKVAQKDLVLDRAAPLYARTCPEWLCRALDILVDNAVEATAKRTDLQSPRQVIVSTSKMEAPLAGERVPSLRNRRWIQILVSDNGPGISPTARAYILRERVPKKKEERGMGLGLLMARSIVQVYGGDIELVHSDSTGTKMAIRLPLVPMEGGASSSG